MKIKLKRVYDPASKEDGTRILVERLWPRGIKKENLTLDFWIKELAPSTELRKWFCHDPAKWEQFKKEYVKELENNKDFLSSFLKKFQGQTITFLYSSKDTEHNNAVCLQKYLENKAQRL